MEAAIWTSYFRKISHEEKEKDKSVPETEEGHRSVLCIGWKESPNRAKLEIF